LNNTFGFIEMKLNDNKAIEVLRFEPTGDLYWRGRKIESDAELREAVIDVHRCLCVKAYAKPSKVYDITGAEPPPPDSGFAKLGEFE
jgi:hypothetical protein